MHVAGGTTTAPTGRCVICHLLPLTSYLLLVPLSLVNFQLPLPVQDVHARLQNGTGDRGRDRAARAAAFNDHDERQRVIVVCDKAGKRGSIGVGSDLGGAGLGADLHAGNIHRIYVRSVSAALLESMRGVWLVIAS